METSIVVRPKERPNPLEALYARAVRDWRCAACGRFTPLRTITRVEIDPSEDICEYLCPSCAEKEL